MTTNEVALVERHRPPLTTVTDKLALAQELAGAGLLPRAYQRNPQNLLWAIEYGEALGIHPTAVINGVHVIDGKPTASAQLIGGLVRRAGHILRVRFDRQTMTATAQIIRCDDPEFIFESVWTMDRAKAANLAGKGVWKQYPDAMLKARAITEVARDAAPEALMGVAYTPEELGAEVRLDADGEIVGVVEPAALSVPAAQAKRQVLEAAGGDVDVARQVWADEVGEAAALTPEQLEAVCAAAADAQIVDADVLEGTEPLDLDTEVTV